MLTATTITDEQIRELLHEAEAHVYPGSDPRWRDQWNAADDALDRDGMHGDIAVQSGRARCAKILNARASKP